MALNKRKTSTKTLFLASLGFGLGFSAVFLPMADLLRQAHRSIPELRDDIRFALDGAEPLLSQAVVGTLLFGLGAYLLLRLALASFARRTLGEFAAELRRKNLLSYHFEAKKQRKTTWDYQQGVYMLMDSYVERLQEAHIEKEKYKQALSSYADPTVQERLKYETDQMKIKSGKRRIAVLFSDIRGFTRISEHLLAEEVVGILNDYFAFSTDLIRQNKGQVNKFIGDAVMAIFEDPAAYKEDESAVRNAANAGLAMVEQFHDHLPAWKERISSHFDCDLGVGIHYGEAVVGNLGSTERMEYTAIGDTVNFASRLCSLAKSGQVILSEPSFEKVHNFFEGSAQEPVAVKNKSGLHTTYVVRRRRETRG